MSYNNIIEVLSLISKDKCIRISFILVILLSCALSLVLGYVSGVIVVLSYILGYAVALLLINYENYTSSALEKLLALYMVHSMVRPKFKASCSVCDDLSCNRHLTGKDVAPWKKIKINEDLNEAVEHFYNRILKMFITSWYEQFTENKNFLNELQFCLKYATATLINRFFVIDYITLITNKLVPQAIKHIDDYLYMQQIAKLKNVKFNEVVVEYLGKKLHPATTNRKNEIEYLQHLSSELITVLLPDQYIKCRNYSILLREILSGWVLLPLMDVLADPNIINSLVIIAVNYKPTKSSRIVHTIKEVEFLENFLTPNDDTSSFAINLYKIKNNVELLYPFIQFLKKEEQVHMLQFCLDVDDFNTKLLTPDLSKKELEELHGKAKLLYNKYLQEESINFIGCSKDICEEFNDLIKDIYNVAKLRTSKPLFQAYDYTFNYLEAVWLPKFFHSNEFYSYICGSKVTAAYQKSSAKNKKYCEQPTTVSKLSSSLGRIKGVLKAPMPIEGVLDPLDNYHLENDLPEDIILSENLMRDLSSWKVTIPTCQVDNTTKITYFCLNVLHMDKSTAESKTNNWIVWRKDQDFFTLKSKLIEFHGVEEICDSPLPARRLGAGESRILRHEEFIKKLLQKPKLRGSDLLYTFLTCKDDFTLVITTLAPNSQDIGNIYQSVAHKLRKEKGQHLDVFMTTFLNSVAKQKCEKVDLAQEGVTYSDEKTRTTPKTLHNNVFKDNFGITYKQCSDSSSSSFSPTLFSECLFYLFKNIFHIPVGLLKLYVALCSVAQQLIDLFSRKIIEKKLKIGLSQSNLGYLIGLLEGVIFDHHVTHTPQDYEERKINAFKNIRFCPGYLDKICGGAVNDGLTTLLEILQNPHYNKQLAYNLIDIALLEIFPELAKE